MKRPFNEEKCDIQVTICPIYLTKQKQMLYALMDQKQVEWTDEMREAYDGLLNLLDYIEDQVRASGIAVSDFPDGPFTNRVIGIVFRDDID